MTVQQVKHENQELSRAEFIIPRTKFTAVKSMDSETDLTYEKHSMRSWNVQF